MPLAPILLIPLDDRPCNLSQVVRLAKIAGIDVITPPLESMGSRFRAPDFQAQAQWLKENAKRSSAIVLSLDQWCYGGLVQSRVLQPSRPEPIDELLKILCDTAVPTYAFNVLLRLTVTINKKSDETIWREVFQYCQDPENYDLSQGLIPADVLEEFLNARKRNHSLNVEALKLLPALETLVYCQEDCTPQGIHQKERAALEAASRNTEQNKKIHWFTGADELGATLVSRAINDLLAVQKPALKHQPKWNITTTETALLNQVSEFEDISIIENWNAHVKVLWPEPSQLDSPEVTVHLLPFEGHQPDLSVTPAAELKERPLEFIRATLKIPEPIHFLDLSCGNGIHPQLVGWATERHQRGHGFSSFSAWNTTGNRLGTFLGTIQLILSAKAVGVFDAQAHHDYVSLRVVDDAVYQGSIRAQLTELMGSKDRWNLENQPELEALAQAQLDSIGFGNWKIALPWGRLFEAEFISANPQ